MAAPLISVAAETPIAEAARLMASRKISSVVVVQDKTLGIFTEGDAIRALAADADAKRESIARYLTSPVVTVNDDDFVFVAIGRMQRLGVRHLPVVSRGTAAPVGMVSARTLLKLRSADSLALGDKIAAAPDAAALREVHDSLGALARDLRSEDVGAHEIAEVESALVRDMTARAAALAEAAMLAEGQGPAPAPWCVLVLGSGGRGESLLSADQDNAIVMEDGAPDGWYAEAGKRMADTLDAAGIPYCKGGVMAREAQWRGTLSTWQARIAAWVAKPKAENLLSVDIFYDFAPVYGDAGLAAKLRQHALAEAKGSLAFLRLLAAEVEQLGAPLDAFGRFRTEEGRADLKKGALLAIVGGARALALRHGIAETGTAERLKALIASGHINVADAEGLIAAQATVQRFVLDQQLVDIAAGLAPSPRVEIGRLKKRDKDELKTALKKTAQVSMILADMR